MIKYFFIPSRSFKVDLTIPGELLVLSGRNNYYNLQIGYGILASLLIGAIIYNYINGLRLDFLLFALIAVFLRVVKIFESVDDQTLKNKIIFNNSGILSTYSSEVKLRKIFSVDRDELKVEYGHNTLVFYKRDKNAILFEVRIIDHSLSDVFKFNEEIHKILGLAERAVFGEYNRLNKSKTVGVKKRNRYFLVAKSRGVYILRVVREFIDSPIFEKHLIVDVKKNQVKYLNGFFYKILPLKEVVGFGGVAKREGGVFGSGDYKVTIHAVLRSGSTKKIIDFYPRLVDRNEYHDRDNLKLELKEIIAEMNHFKKYSYEN